MEEDDGFGDLYSDVLKPFSSTLSSSSAPQPHHTSPAPSPLNPPIDLTPRTLDDQIFCGSSHFNSGGSHQPAHQTQVPHPAVPAARDGEERVDADLLKRSMLIEKDFVRGETDVNLMDKDVKFDIEEEIGGEPMIAVVSGGGELAGNDDGIGNSERNDDGNGDDWDSDSEDDLQIVLNDDDHRPMGMGRGGMAAGDDEDDDDEDGDPLVILADNGPPIRAMDELERGDEAGQGGDGERKEGEAGKSSGGMAIGMRVGYINHGYHPYHSQFKVSVTC